MQVLSCMFAWTLRFKRLTRCDGCGLMPLHALPYATHRPRVMHPAHPLLPLLTLQGQTQKAPLQPACMHLKQSGLGGPVIEIVVASATG